MNTCGNCIYWESKEDGFGECVFLINILRPVIQITDEMKWIGIHFRTQVCTGIDSPENFGCIRFSPAEKGRTYNTEKR